MLSVLADRPYETFEVATTRDHARGGGGAEVVGRADEVSRIQMEPTWRLLAVDLVGDEVVLESHSALHDQVAGLSERLDVAEAVAQTIPHKERHLLLNHALARRIVDAHSEWLDEVERELGARDARRAASRKPL